VNRIAAKCGEHINVKIDVIEMFAAKTPRDRGAWALVRMNGRY